RRPDVFLPGPQQQPKLSYEPGVTVSIPKDRSRGNVRVIPVVPDTAKVVRVRLVLSVLELELNQGEAPVDLGNMAELAGLIPDMPHPLPHVARAAIRRREGVRVRLNLPTETH